MGVVTTSSQNTFQHRAETIYDFVTDPANWTKTYPGSKYVGNLHDLPLKVGDTWEEGGPDGDRIFTWHLAMAYRPTLWMFTSVGRLGHDRSGEGGMAGRITVEYRFSQPTEGLTLFTRTMTVEAPRDSPMPDNFFRIVNPANIDRYHDAIARELGATQRPGR
ncbi:MULTISPECIES: SRPBCC family protein [Mycobacteriaceae]|uniref:SRPBCC family protein n=1 Tax=Mycolicibacterium mucogenicum DSM 44124 TaxID=1226753 RepID=A0A8H2PGM9_MYCMU|nr:MULTISPECIES: SRPBCC family protein [Mycobacteriaceae]KAB7758054.1 polyketide cyclase [Mycolicibacterium mucogenicum DSM 44124]QPG71480.1 SRPBCC family protein [Mycolicibacterium mucogenicum DSM 44124]